MMTYLVNALLQPKYSSRGPITPKSTLLDSKDYQRKSFDGKNEERKDSEIENQTKTQICSTKIEVDKVPEQSNQILIYLTNKEESSKQLATKRYKIDELEGGNKQKVKPLKMLPQKERISMAKQVNLWLSNKKNKYLNNKRKYKDKVQIMKEVIKLILELKPIKTLNSLILMSNKIYLYIKSQIIIYKNKLKMEIKIENINIFWKTNKDTFDAIESYFHYMDTNRIYFITWKIQTLILKSKLIYNIISWHFVKRNNIYENIIDTKLGQNGVKIRITMSDTEREYDKIWTAGKKAEIEAKTMTKYMEIEDLLDSVHKKLFPPKQNAKFKKKILNIDANTCIRKGIILNEYDKQLWMLVEEVEDDSDDSDL